MNSRKFFYDFGKALYHVDSFYDEFAKQSNSHTQIEISNDWELPKTTVNTVIKDIQKQGYVELVPIKGKRREMSIVLTESGKAFADNVLSDLYRKEEEVFKLLSPKEQEIVMVLEKLARKLKEED